jgi:hypothetical protein
MSKSATSPVWPFLSVLACLFVLSITAPRAWERLAHKGELAKRLDAIKRIRQTERLAQVAKSQREKPSAEPTLSPPEACPLDQFCQSPVDHTPAWERRRLERSRQVELGPPVAQIQTVEPLQTVEQIHTAEQIQTFEPSLFRGLLIADDSQFSASPVHTEPNFTAQKIETAQPIEADPQIEMVGPALAPHALQTAPAFGNLAPEFGKLETAGPLPVDTVALPAPAESHQPEAKLLEPETLVPPPVAEIENVARSTPDARLMPVALLKQLVALEADAYTREWANSVQCRLQALAGDAATTDKSLFDDLANSARSAQELAEAAPDAIMETRLLRAKFALERRLPLWRAVFDSAAASAERTEQRRAARAAAPRTGFSPRLRTRIDRLTGLRNKLRPTEDATWTPNSAIAPEEDVVATNLRQLLAEVEAYEQSGLPSDATAVAMRRRSIAPASSPAQQRLIADLEEHYENANLRVAVSGHLINRLLPHPDAMRLPVSETLAGVPVRGQATTWTQLHARLIPDPQRVRIGLEASGTVASDTFSTSGPATFRNAGRSTFLVQKLFVLGPWGLRSWSAISDARTVGGSLISLETDYDGIPLFGSLVRSVARSQFDDSQAVVRSEADAKLAQRSRMQFDMEMGARLGKVEANFDEKVSRPIKRLGLDITPIAFATTEDRIIARYRLAASDQLGAHTPRPRAPSDSLLSVQLHESAINNLLAKLGLEGRRFKLPELLNFVAAKMNRAPGKLAEDVPDDLALTFADEDAVRVRLRDNKLELRLSFAAVEHGRNHWRDFTVTTSYGLISQGLTASLQRESGVFLDGPGLKGRAELVLRGIFSRALSRNRHIELGSEQLAQDPRLQDLAVSQLLIDDGWLGIAVGPNNVDREARVRRVKTPASSSAPTTSLH